MPAPTSLLALVACNQSFAKQQAEPEDPHQRQLTKANAAQTAVCDPLRCQSFSMHARVMHATAIGTNGDRAMSGISSSPLSVRVACVVITHPILDCSKK